MNKAAVYFQGRRIHNETKMLLTCSEAKRNMRKRRPGLFLLLPAAPQHHTKVLIQAQCVEHNRIYTITGVDVSEVWHGKYGCTKSAYLDTE